MNMHLCGALGAGLSMVISANAQDVLIGSWATGDVRRFDATTGAFRGIFIPQGSGGLGFPDGLAYGPDGNLYVADPAGSRVLRYHGQTGAFIDIFASQGISRAGYCAFGPDGNFYVCSAGTNSVLRYNPSTGALIDTFAVGGGLGSPAGLLWHGSHLYVAGFGSGGVYRYNATTGAFVDRFVGSTQPLYIRVGSDGDLYVSEYRNNRVARFDLDTRALVGSITHPNLSGPVGQLALPDGSLLVTSWNNGLVHRFNESTRSYIGVFTNTVTRANDMILMPVPAPAGAWCVLTALGVVACRRRR